MTGPEESESDGGCIICGKALSSPFERCNCPPESSDDAEQILEFDPDYDTAFVDPRFDNYWE